MCTNFTPTTKDKLNQFGVDASHLPEWKAEAWQDYAAPIIRHDAQGNREAMLAAYSMIPKVKMPPNVKRFSTMNARAETIGSLRSFAKPWREGKLCLVPMKNFYEPCYESGKAERWCIHLKEAENFAVAGLYKEWEEEDGAPSFSFTQITINADEHPLMQRFHQPGDEKRSLVILHKAHFDDWLSCKNPEYARSFLTLFPAELMQAHAAPIIRKKPIITTLSLFD